MKVLLLFAIIIINVSSFYHSEKEIAKAFSVGVSKLCCPVSTAIVSSCDKNCVVKQSCRSQCKKKLTSSDKIVGCENFCYKISEEVSKELEKDYECVKFVTKKQKYDQCINDRVIKIQNRYINKLQSKTSDDDMDDGLSFLWNNPVSKKVTKKVYKHVVKPTFEFCEDSYKTAANELKEFGDTASKEFKKNVKKVGDGFEKSWDWVKKNFPTTCKALGAGKKTCCLFKGIRYIGNDLSFAGNIKRVTENPEDYFKKFKHFIKCFENWEGKCYFRFMNLLPKSAFDKIGDCMGYVDPLDFIFDMCKWISEKFFMWKYRNKNNIKKLCCMKTALAKQAVAEIKILGEAYSYSVQKRQCEADCIHCKNQDICIAKCWATADAVKSTLSGGNYGRGLTAITILKCFWKKKVEKAENFMKKYNIGMNKFSVADWLIKPEKCEDPKKKKKSTAVTVGGSKPIVINLGSSSLSGGYKANWWGSLDKKGWSECSTNYYVTGLYRNKCDNLYCIEEGYCKKISGAGGQNCMKKSFNSLGWNNCQKEYAVRGFYREKHGCSGLNCLKAARCCRPSNVKQQDCYEENIGKSFDRKGWVSCSKNGYVLSGIYRNTNGCNKIYCIEKLRCCRFTKSGGVRIVIPRSRYSRDLTPKYYTHSWWKCFDDQGWCACNKGYFLKGLWRNKRGCEGIYCIEKAKCEKPKYLTSSGVTCKEGNWWSSFDRKGWSKCPSGYFLYGLWRNKKRTCGEGLNCIEKVNCCRPKDAKTYYKHCYVESVWKSFDDKGMSTCKKRGYYLAGLWRNTCNKLYCIEEFYCCSIQY